MIIQALPPLQTALSLVDSLDAAAADLFQPTPSTLMQISKQDQGVSIARSAAQHFLDIAAELDQLLQHLQQAASVTGANQLAEEVSALEEELKAKDALILECQQKIQGWQQQCHDLQAVQKSALNHGIA